MEDKRNLHLKVQELCDCFATTDYLEEMSKLAKDQDQDEAALKWLALTVLHAVNAGAKKITLFQAPDGAISVQAKYRASTLPSPGADIGPKVIEAVRAMTHAEGDKVKALLALGVRNDNLEVKVKTEKEDGGQLLTLKFPE
ncbi:MAG: hypothetical protein K9K65_13260 [Desulfarculaceae bacterium]|nr:hypothetical protein [Desulfarculaceae bacterium]MCF8047463.1 hypothetical protein [Desulfarculaceae bacterium]MCF8065349.1 hypothetical protein [Desulfarculaceae bacterium]MCF8098803.1 hypothetical protein [Desulfarculaceae bacterium]MCF8124116.1 hypothetical protein [Desulfarculaceae bacterium]